MRSSIEGRKQTGWVDSFIAIYLVNWGRRRGRLRGFFLWKMLFLSCLSPRWFPKRGRLQEIGVAEACI